MQFPLRAARTLLYYLMETNLNVHHWLLAFMRAYPIPRVRAPMVVSPAVFCAPRAAR